MWKNNQEQEESMACPFCFIFKFEENVCLSSISVLLESSENHFLSSCEELAAT